MAESKGNKRRIAISIALIILLGVVITGIFAITGIVNQEPPEVIITQTGDARLTDPAADSWEEPPTETLPPTDVQTTESTPTATGIPTNSLTNPVPQGTLKFTPELFIYHTP